MHSSPNFRQNGEMTNTLSMSYPLEEGTVVVVDVEETYWFTVQLQLLPRQHLCKFLHCSYPSWEGYEHTGLIEAEEGKRKGGKDWLLDAATVEALIKDTLNNRDKSSCIKEHTLRSKLLY